MNVFKFFSIILHPIFTPIIFIYLSLIIIPQAQICMAQDTAVFFITLIIITIIIPLTCILIMLKKNIISSYEIKKKEERFSPLLITALCYIILLAKLNLTYALDPIIEAQIIGVTIILFSALIISIFWKISLHMLGVGGGCGIILGLYLISEKGLLFLVGLFIASFFLSICRKKEKAHNNTQLIIGFFVGLIIEFSCILFFI